MRKVKWRQWPDSFPHALLWGEREVRSVANLPRADGEEFPALLERVPVRAHVHAFPLREANAAVDALRSGTVSGAAARALAPAALEKDQVAATSRFLCGVVAASCTHDHPEPHPPSPAGGARRPSHAGAQAMSAEASIVTLTLNPALDLSTRTAKVEPAHKLRCAAAQAHPGGGGINVARVIDRLGGSVKALYPAGGPTGERLGQLLDQEGVPRMAVSIAGETRESFSVVEEASGREYRFVLPGPRLAPQEWQDCLESTAAAAAGCAFVVASGSLPPGVPADGYAQLARRLAQARIPLVLDTSGPALAEALQAGVHLIKPSLRELEELTGAVLGTSGARVEACRAIIARGQAQVVALSLGAEGALLVTAREAWQAPALPVAVAGTIGAGDSFLAGLVFAVARGEPLPEAFRTAMAASAAALLRPGTSLCRPEDVAALRPQVVLASC